MKDIARDLGLSVVTVSKVLRDYPDIGAETRESVLRRIKELNYRPNPAARALVTGRSYIIGLVVPTLVHPFSAEVARGLSGVLRKGATTWRSLLRKRIRSWSSRRSNGCWTAG